MTNTLKIAVEELSKRPKEVQESWGTAILKGLGIYRVPEQESTEEAAEPYSSFKFLQEADVELSPDASVTYERDLYGREDDIDA